MTQFFELLVSGLSLGFVYALIALGFVVIFKATRVVNFAHGSIVLLGAYVVARTARERSASRAPSCWGSSSRGRRSRCSCRR